MTNVVRYQKSYFDVLGICCSSEVPLIERILKPLEGIQKVSVIVPSRTVIVVHDNLLVSQTQIVKVLNQARLEANIRVFGEEKNGKLWPSPYTIASGCLLLLSFLKYFYHPLQWLAVGAVAVGLPPILMRSLAAIRSLTLDINILVLIAVAGTLALRDYWEAGSIVFLFTVAEWLESRASHKATAVMSSLMSMAPQKAVLAESGIVVDTKDVKVNTVLAVKAGEVIPIDGIVIDGNSEVDEKTLTGESLPVAKQIQSNVWAGTMNLNGYISVKTTSLAEDSAVAMMAKLVEEAQHNKSKTQRLIDNCAKYYTPIVVLISGAVAVIPVVLKAHNLRHWFHLALVLLVSACPCALILSTPVAIFCALAKAATMGLLVKGGDYLEALARVKVVAFDKTGTITRGEFTVTECQSLSQDVSSTDLLYWVSSIESKASHPVAAALVEYSQSNGIEPNPANVEDFQIFPGEGIYGKMNEKEIYIGNSRIATRTGCTTVPLVEGVRDGSTVVYVFLKGTAVGILRLSDTCRTGAVEAIKELKSLGIRTVMLTGDNRAAAAHIQHQLGERLEEVHAELLPEEKVKLIKDLKHRCGPTAMVGDGMNDAPALATADIGISMGISGSAVAIETGQVTLMSNDIRKIPFAICISRNTRRRIIENVALSIATKAAILGLALAGHPLLWAAVAADVGTCLLVIFNSMRLMGGTRVSHAEKCSDTPDEHNDHGHSHGHNHDHDHNHNHDHNHHNHGRCASISCGLFGSKHEAHTTCSSADEREGLAAAAHWSCGDDHHEHGDLEKHARVPSVRDCSKSCTRGKNGCHDHSSGVADEVGSNAGAVDKGCGSDIEAHMHEGGCCK